MVLWVWYHVCLFFYNTICISWPYSQSSWKRWKTSNVLSPLISLNGQVIDSRWNHTLQSSLSINMCGLNSFSSIYRTLWLSGSLRRGPGHNNIGAALRLAIFENAPLDTLSASRQIKQSASMLWSAENQIWSIFIQLPSQLSSSLCSCSADHSVCLFLLQPRQMREMDTFSPIYVVITQKLY